MGFSDRGGVKKRLKRLLHLVAHLLQVFTPSQIFALLMAYYTATALVFF